MLALYPLCLSPNEYYTAKKKELYLHFYIYTLLPVSSGYFKERMLIPKIDINRSLS